MTSCKPPPTCIDASPIPDANDSRMSAIPYEANLTPMGAHLLRHPAPTTNQPIRATRLVAAALRFRIVHSAIARPQGRGKVERLFGTITTELLPDLPGHLVAGQPASPPRLSL